MSKLENLQDVCIFLDKMLRFSAKMGKRKADKEDPASSTSSQPPSRKKGHGKGASNIIHVYRNEGKVVTQAEVHPQPESHSQEPQPEAQES